MSNTKPEDRIPAVVLWHKGARRYEVTGKQKVELKLEGEILDEEVWKEVEQKFMSGFHVFTVEDFKGEMLNAFREENHKLEQAKLLLEQALERAQREKLIAEQELARFKGPLTALGQRLKGGQ